jgi:RNA polymerase sigma-70 factor (ECF subfamily)
MVSTEAHVNTVADIADESELPDKDYGRSQIRGLLESKVEQLPEAFRLVFVLRSVEELTVEEVAQVLGIPEETVRSRHFRARGLLRESLAREVDLAERDLFDFGGTQCDAVVARVLEKL